MSKILLAAALAVTVAAGGTAAEAHHRTAHAVPSGFAKKCAKLRKIGFVVKGTFVSGDATSVTVHVTKANRHALNSGLVTVGSDYVASPTDPARIRYVNRTGPGDAQLTDKVRVVGKVTKLKRGCTDLSFTPEAKVRRVMVIAPEQP